VLFVLLSNEVFKTGEALLLKVIKALLNAPASNIARKPSWQTFGQFPLCFAYRFSNKQ
jgi:hypothetical protein